VGATSVLHLSMTTVLTVFVVAETMMTIHFSADLRPVVKDRVGMLHWIMDPMARGFIIAYDLGGNQVLIHNFDVSARRSLRLRDGCEAADSSSSHSTTLSSPSPRKSAGR
jgi:hypothetical protein